MFSFRKEKVNERSNATRAILVKNKRSQASPALLVKNKEEKRKDILLLFLCISVFALLLSSCGRTTEGEILKAPAED